MSNKVAFVVRDFFTNNCFSIDLKRKYDTLKNYGTHFTDYHFISRHSWASS